MAWLDNLVAAYHLAEASGDAVDAYAGLTLTDNGSVGAAGADGRVFTAASSQFFERADDANFSLGDIDFTFGLRIKIAADTGATQMLVTKGGTSDFNGSEFLLYRSASDSKLYFDVGSGSGVGEVGSTGTLSNGVAYFVLAWHEATANTLNLRINNGTPDAASWSGGSCNSTYPFRMGATSDGTRYFNGAIKEFHFWKRILTSGEQTDAYNGSVYPFSGAAQNSGMFFGA